MSNLSDFILKKKDNAKVYFDHNPKEDIRVRVKVDDDQYWIWCCDNLVEGQYQALISLMGETATYIFKDPADAVVFKLKFGL